MPPKRAPHGSKASSSSRSGSGGGDTGVGSDGLWKLHPVRVGATPLEHLQHRQALREERRRQAANATAPAPAEPEPEPEPEPGAGVGVLPELGPCEGTPPARHGGHAVAAAAAAGGAARHHRPQEAGEPGSPTYQLQPPAVPAAEEERCAREVQVQLARGPASNPWALVDEFAQAEASAEPSQAMYAVCRELTKAERRDDPSMFKQEADTKFVTIYKDRNKQASRRLFLKVTKAFPFAPEAVWRAGQSADYMSKLDKNVVDVQVIGALSPQLAGTAADYHERAADPRREPVRGHRVLEDQAAPGGGPRLLRLSLHPRAAGAAVLRDGEWLRLRPFLDSRFLTAVSRQPFLNSRFSTAENGVGWGGG
jgi:hypothetical protein